MFDVCPEPVLVNIDRFCSYLKRACWQEMMTGVFFRRHWAYHWVRWVEYSFHWLYLSLRNASENSVPAPQDKTRQDKTRQDKIRYDTIGVNGCWLPDGVFLSFCLSVFLSPFVLPFCLSVSQPLVVVLSLWPEFTTHRGWPASRRLPRTHAAHQADTGAASASSPRPPLPPGSARTCTGEH